MSKQVQQMRRMLLIFDKLKRPGQVSKQELLDYVNRKMEDCYGSLIFLLASSSSVSIPN